MTPGLFAGLTAARRGGYPVATLTDLASGHQALLLENGPAAGFSESIRRQASAMLAVSASGSLEEEGRLVFVRSYGPINRTQVAAITDEDTGESVSSHSRPFQNRVSVGCREGMIAR